jgi:uncharacterized protein (DUF58 family)
MARPNAPSRLRKFFPARPQQVYIIPTGFGALYATGLLLMLLMAYTYQNNFAYLMTFFLTSFGFGVMFSTHRFVQGAKLEAKAIPLYEEGEKITPPFRRLSPDEAPQAARLRPPKSTSLKEDAGGTWLLIKRGWHDVDSVQVQSRFPLGLFQAWKKVPTQVTIVAIPRAVDHGLNPLTGEARGDEASAIAESAAEELRGLAPAREGAPNSQIDWKALARGRGLVQKEFESPQNSRAIIDWSRTRALASLEDRLQQMSYWIRQARRARRSVEIHLPDESVTNSPDEALRFLAKWESP